MAGFTLDNTSLRFCVDQIRGNTLCGRVFSRRLTCPITFEDVGSLALELERVFNQQNFPQAFQRARTFLREEQAESRAAAEPLQGMSGEEVAEQRGEIATFVVLVRRRRNSTWQGHIDWMDGTQKLEFSSFLELFRLMNGRFLGDPVAE